MIIYSLITKTLYQKRKMIFWWFIAMAALTSFTLYFYPTLKGSNIGRVFNSLPVSLQKIAGSADSFTSLGGYISQEIFGLRVPLLIIILSIVIFTSLTVGEERRGILETQITLPITRSKLLLSKLLSSILVLVISLLGTFLGLIIGLLVIHDHFSYVQMGKYILECFLLGLDFGLIAFFLSSRFGSSGIAVGISTTIAIASYFLTTITSSSLNSVQKLSLFHYYQNLDNLNLHNMLVLILVGVILIFLSFILFTNRDIDT